MENRYIGAVVCLAIVVVLTGSLLMPVINDAIEPKDYYNDIGESFAMAPSDGAVNISITITLGESGSGIITVDDTAQNIISGDRALILADNYKLKQTPSAGFALYGVGDGSIIRKTQITAATINVDDNVSSISATLADNSTATYSFTSEWIYYLKADGGFNVLDNVAGSIALYVNSIDQLCGSNVLSTTNEYFSFVGGNVKVNDGTNIEFVEADVSLTRVTNGVYKLVVNSDRTAESNYSFVVDNNGEPYEVYPYHYVVPSIVQSEPEITQAGLLLTAPVLVLVAALAGIITLSIRSRY